MVTTLLELFMIFVDYTGWFLCSVLQSCYEQRILEYYFQIINVLFDHFYLWFLGHRTQWDNG